MTRHTISAALLGLAVLTTSQLAAQQENAAPQDGNEPMAAAAQPAGEARELTVEISPEEYEMKLFRADPALLEQKYAAVIRLKAERRAGGRYDGFFPAELRSRLRIANVWFVPPFAQTSIQGTALFGQFFEKLAPDLPDDLQLSEEQLRYFYKQSDLGYVSIQHPEGVAVFGGGSDSTSMEHVVAVIAPDQANAEARARAVLNMLDYGVFLPIQKTLAAQLIQTKADLADRQVEAARSAEALAELDDQLKGSEDISNETIGELRNQRRLLAVDLAGVEARVNACTEILARLDRTASSRIEQVENIKIAAEIELAGLAARRKSLDLIITDAIRLNELKQKRFVAAQEHERDHRAAADSRERMDNLRDAQRYLAPPAVVDNKIVVRPIKWTNQ